MAQSSSCWSFLILHFCFRGKSLQCRVQPQNLVVREAGPLTTEAQTNQNRDQTWGNNVADCRYISVHMLEIWCQTLNITQCCPSTLALFRILQEFQNMFKTCSNHCADSGEVEQSSKGTTRRSTVLRWVWAEATQQSKLVLACPSLSILHTHTHTIIYIYYTVQSKFRIFYSNFAIFYILQ